MNLKQLEKFEDKSHLFKPNERLILLSLCIYANESGFAFMSPKKLQKRTGITYRTNMNTSLRDLEKIGVISRTTRPNSKGKLVQGVLIHLDEFNLPTEIKLIYPLDEFNLPPRLNSSNIRSHRSKSEENKNSPSAENVKKKKLKKASRKKIEKKKKIEKGEMEMKKKNEMKNPCMGKTPKEIAEKKFKIFPMKKKINACTLANVWELAHAEYYPDIFIGPCKVDEMAMFKSYIKFATYDYAVSALLCAVKNWVSFVKFCEKHGAVSKPSTPKIKFLLKYSAESVTFYQSKQTTVLSPSESLSNMEPTAQEGVENKNHIPNPKGIQENGLQAISDVPMTPEQAKQKLNEILKKGKK